MRNRNFVFDATLITSLFIILSSTRIIFNILLPKEPNKEGMLLPGLAVHYSIFLYILCVIIFILYGYLLRRRFIKNQTDKEEKALIYPFKIIIPIFLIILIYTLVIQATIFRYNEILVDISNSTFEILQLTSISFIIGIIGYVYIEKYLGSILFKEILLEDKKRLGIGLFQSQTSNLISRFWKSGLILLGIIISIANFLVFLIYPTIPANSSSSTITIAFPDFRYRYDPGNGFRQEIFSLFEIPSSYFFDWKLLQSILCLIIFGITILFIYLPIKKAERTEKPTLEKKLQEDSLENISYNILSPDIEIDSYLPSIAITNKSKGRMKKILDKTFHSDFVPVMGLLAFNITLSLLMVAILTNLGIPISSSLQTEISTDEYFISVSQLYWAGFNEEITFRLLLIGVPLFVIYGFYYLLIVLLKFVHSRRKEKEMNASKFMNKLLSQSPINPFLYLTGRWKKIRILDFVLLLISSFAFGFVHYQISYPYWDVGKIIQAGIAGLVFGYAYIKYGLHAAIFLHAANDFIIGLVLTLNLGLIVLEEIILLLIIVFGALYIIYYASISLVYLFKAISKLLGRTTLIATNKTTTEK